MTLGREDHINSATDWEMQASAMDMPCDISRLGD